MAIDLRTLLGSSVISNEIQLRSPCSAAVRVGSARCQTCWYSAVFMMAPRDQGFKTFISRRFRDTCEGTHCSFAKLSSGAGGPAIGHDPANISRNAETDGLKK